MTKEEIIYCYNVVKLLSALNFDEFDTSRFVFAQSLYFSSRASKSNLDGAQEPKHAPDFSQKVLDTLITRFYEENRKMKNRKNLSIRNINGIQYNPTHILCLLL
ncbi:MAG: hypothetical protein AABW75_00345 [Nanoarchaeota archaeon]